MLTYLSSFIKAIVAGIAIAIGGTVFLSCLNPVVGALLFSVGLFIVLYFDLSLYTGRSGYILFNQFSLIPHLIIIWIGNFLGCYVYARFLSHSRSSILPRVVDMCEKKLSQSFGSTFFLAFMCGILMFIAVDNFANNKSDVGKNIGIFLCVSSFILCGFEHSIADIFYFSAANCFSLDFLASIIYILIVTVGNALGSLLIPYVRKLSNYDSKL